MITAFTKKYFREKIDKIFAKPLIKISFDTLIPLNPILCSTDWHFFWVFSCRTSTHRLLTYSNLTRRCSKMPWNYGTKRNLQQPRKNSENTSNGEAMAKKPSKRAFTKASAPWNSITRMPKHWSQALYSRILPTRWPMSLTDSLAIIISKKRITKPQPRSTTAWITAPFLPRENRERLSKGVHLFPTQKVRGSCRDFQSDQNV